MGVVYTIARWWEIRSPKIEQELFGNRKTGGRTGRTRQTAAPAAAEATHSEGVGQ